jgi:cytochrome c-type biogenesis protein CcmE
MDPSRKRKIRFVVALSVAVLLAGALVYTSFSASSEARTPSQLMTGAETGKVYKLTGKV